MIGPMSKRNIVWLIVVIVSGVIGVLVFGFPWGLVVPAVTLAVSEVVERRRRSQLRAAADSES